MTHALYRRDVHREAIDPPRTTYRGRATTRAIHASPFAPQANLASRRISELLEGFDAPNQKRIEKQRKTGEEIPSPRTLTRGGEDAHREKRKGGAYAPPFQLICIPRLTSGPRARSASAARRLDFQA